MEYRSTGVWDIIKGFVIGWGIALGLLVIVSCVKYREFIATAFTNNVWALVNAVMPIVIIVFVLFYLLRSVFR